MLRALESLLFFLAPFILYAGLLLLRRNRPFSQYYWRVQTISGLTIAGLAVAVAGLFFFGLTAERHRGAYIPAHIENGKLVPGRLE
jgi:amino acid transporter